MLDELFALRLLLSFVIGGVWVTMITLATVRYGAKVGGLLAGFPATVAFSLVFIGWTQSVETAVDATNALPLALGATGSYALVYATLVKRLRFEVSMLGALGFWAICSFVFTDVVLRIDLAFWLSVVGFYFFTGLLYLALGDKMKGATAVSHGIRPTAFQWTWRFTLSGGVIACAVYLSQSLGPLIGGVFSSFPAIITSTLYIVRRVEGIEASRSMAVPVLVSTIFSIVPFVIVVRYSFPYLGVVLGTIAGYCAALPLSFLAFYLLSRSNRSSPSKTR